MNTRARVDLQCQHVVVFHDPQKWAAVPANNGGNGPIWQWGDELLVGFTVGSFVEGESLHQTTNDEPFVSWLGRSVDGGASWSTWVPDGYAGQGLPAAPGTGAVDMDAPGFVLRVEGNAYHGNQGAHWFYSLDRGASWSGPFDFGRLLDHPELREREFTGRTGYVINGPRDMMLFLSARQPDGGDPLRVRPTDQTFVAQTTDGGVSFRLLSWVVGLQAPCRAVMPAPVRLTKSDMVVTLRRKSATHNWIDCYATSDNGVTWRYLSKVGVTEDGNEWNGNPPAMLRLPEGRLCCAYGHRSRRQILVRTSEDNGQTWSEALVLRDDFGSVTGRPDLGYVRLFTRSDERLTAVYFWCTADRPQTHIEATIFSLA